MDMICIHKLSDKFLISSDIQICPAPFFSSTVCMFFWLAFFGMIIDICVCVCQNQRLQNQNSSGCPTKMKYQRSWESPNVAPTLSFSRKQVCMIHILFTLRIKIGFDGFNWLQCPFIETAITWIFEHLYLITWNPEVSGGSWWDLELLWFEEKNLIELNMCSPCV